MPTSRMLNGYCADIEHLLREGHLREAVRLAVALPDICSALESARLQSSRDDYVAWCERWMKLEASGSKPVTGARVFRLYALHMPPAGVHRTTDPWPPALMRLRMRRHARTHRSLGRSRLWHPGSPLEGFQVHLCEALLIATRGWYEALASADPIVQANLGKLVVR